MWTPRVYQCTSALRSVRLTTIGYAQFCSVDCVRERCCWQIEDMTPIGSGRSLLSKARRQTSHQNEIARSQSASAPISTERATWSSGSSTRSSNVVVASPPATKNSQPTILPSSSSHLSGFGYVLMSPRPICNGLEERATKLVNARPEVFVPAFAAWLAPLRQPAPPTTLRLAQRPTLN